MRHKFKFWVFHLAIITFCFKLTLTYADRKPAVDSRVEISLEENNPELTKGFDFKSKTTSPFKKITSNPKHKPSATGIIIFLIAMPAAFWIAISKNLNKSKKITEIKIDYFPQTYQLKKKEGAVVHENEDDEEFPKAS